MDDLQGCKEVKYEWYDLTGKCVVYILLRNYKAQERGLNATVSGILWNQKDFSSLNKAKSYAHAIKIKIKKKPT